MVFFLIPRGYDVHIIDLSSDFGVEPSDLQR